MEICQGFHWSKTSRNTSVTWNLSGEDMWSMWSVGDWSMGLQRQLKKKRVNVILKALDFRVVIATLCCKYCQTSSCSPENTRPLSIARVTSMCFTYGVAVRVVGPFAIIPPKSQNRHKLSTFLYLYYKWRYWYKLCELKYLCTFKHFKGTELGRTLLLSEGLHCKHL